MNAARLLQTNIGDLVINKNLCVHKYIYINKHIEHLNNDNVHIQTVIKDFFRSRERFLERSLDINSLDYKRAEQSDQIMQL